MRTPVFQLHILPMFRASDREHMRSENGLDLWDYDQVRAQADFILDCLKGEGPLMPPVDSPPSGGPWPDEWVQLFQRWKDTGFKRLELGTAQCAFDQGEILATGTFPAAGYVGWLQIETETDTSRTYVLYFEPPDAAVAGIAESFSLDEPYDGPDAQLIYIHDSTGTHQIR